MDMPPRNCISKYGWRTGRSTLRRCSPLPAAAGARGGGGRFLTRPVLSYAAKEYVSPMRKYLMIAASAFVLGAGTMAYVGQSARATPDSKASTYHMLELFGDVHDIIERQYVTKVDDKKLIESALEGMVNSLDPHSDYLTPDAFNDLNDQTRGEYGGLGLEITSEDGAVKVISPIDGTPASRAGIKP